MRLRQLEVERFGLFSGHVFQFHPELTVIFGPNEAGKSTLLQLIREVLFGFKTTQNPYVFDEHVGEMAATAEFDLADESRLRFRRRKGTKGEVVGVLRPAGREIDAAGLRQLTGGATKELYEHVFGFSLRELAEGEESLKRANLTEALYGGGLGGLAHFQKVQAELQSEADALFTPRGRSKQAIHKLLAQIKEQSKELRQQTVKPREYAQLVQQCGEAHAEAERLRLSLDDRRRRASHLERFERALPSWLRLRQARQQLEQITVPPDFPIDGGEQFSRLRTRQQELASELQTIDQDLMEDTEAFKALRLMPEVLGREAIIRSLAQQIKQIEGYRRDLPLRQQESRAIKRAVLVKLRDLHPDWDASHLERFPVTVATREKIERFQQERERIEQRRASLLAQRTGIDADLKVLGKQLNEVQQTDVPASLASLVEESASYQRLLDRLQELESAGREQDHEIDLAHPRLMGPVRQNVTEHVARQATGSLLDQSLPVPMEQTVLEFRDRLAELKAACTEAKRHAAATQSHLGEKEDQLRQLAAKSPVPDRGQLEALRARRDTGWRMIRQQFADGNSIDPRELETWLSPTDAPPADPTQSLALEYESLVIAADAVADERQEKSEQAALHDQLTQEISGLEQRLVTQRESLQECEAELATEVERWENLWAPCHFRPLTPEAMLTWLRDYRSLEDLRSQRAAQRVRIARLRAEVTGFEERLAACLAGEQELPAQLLKRARTRVEEAREHAVQRRTYEEQSSQKREAFQLLNEELRTMEDEARAWRDAWERFLAELRFPHDWDATTTAKVVRTLAELRSESEKSTTLDERCADMQRGLEEFESCVTQLCNDIAPDLADFVPEHAASELHARLESAKLAERDQQRLTVSTDKLRQRKALKQSQLFDTQQQLDRLRALGRTSSDQEFQRVVANAKLRDELQRTCREANAELAAARGAEDETRFAEELAAADEGALAEERSRMERELRSLQRDFDEAFKAATLKEEERKRLSGESRAAALALDLEASRSQLAAAVERWAPLILAQAVMKHALRRFEREHQPAMLSDVERLFAHMTLGRYVGMERKLDEQGTLLVVEESGKRKEPRQLSTGTREQLYLSIRLAYVQHYSRHAEPLPIVMDDVLVNFDAGRARQTLSALLRIAEQTQIVFLTCHQHTVELMQSVMPSCEPVVLPGGDLPEGAITAIRQGSAKAARMH